MEGEGQGRVGQGQQGKVSTSQSSKPREPHHMHNAVCQRQNKHQVSHPALQHGQLIHTYVPVVHTAPRGPSQWTSRWRSPSEHQGAPAGCEETRLGCTSHGHATCTCVVAHTFFESPVSSSCELSFRFFSTSRDSFSIMACDTCTRAYTGKPLVPHSTSLRRQPSTHTEN